jgi:hypothetical protein
MLRMPSSGMWRRVDIVLTDVSEERIASIFRVEKIANEAATIYPCWFIDRGFLIPWSWRRYDPPKRRLTPFLHGATSQKTAFFIVTAVKTSNLTTWMSIVIISSRKIWPNSENSYIVVATSLAFMLELPLNIIFSPPSAATEHVVLEVTL